MMRVMASLKVFDIVYMMIEKTNPAIRSCETILYNFYQRPLLRITKVMDQHWLYGVSF